MQKKHGFTLIELLVVVAIIAVLVAILLPTISKARLMARVTRAHVELRGITIALQMYQQENYDKLPPTRFSCSMRVAYEIPLELIEYLPRGKNKRGLDIVEMRDPFSKSECYKYRAPGPAIINETILSETGSSIWVQDNFPRGDCSSGRYFNDIKTSPVRYAVWSMGPVPHSPEFDIPGHLPVPYKYWFRTSSDAGVITHIQDQNQNIHISP